MNAINHLGTNKVRVMGLGLIVLAAATATLVIVRINSETSQVDIPGVRAQELDQLGVKFFPPNGTPAISADEARLAAISQVPTFDLPILNTVLVRMVDPNSGIDQLVWVNRIDTTGHPLFVSSGNYTAPNLVPTGPWTPEDSQSGPDVATPEPSPQTYYLIFVDANSGAVLYAIGRLNLAAISHLCAIMSACAR